MNLFIKNHFSSLITIIFLTSYFLFLNSCNSTEPPPTPPTPQPTDTVTVSIIDKTHRSITVNVKTTVNNNNWSVELFREKTTSNDSLITEFKVETEDTTIIDDNGGNGLELDTEYSYYTILSTEEGEVKDTSEKVVGRTLGATSHNYVWEEYTIGESGTLYDVWGTDENNVYAVGGFRIDGEFYGIAHWDGTDWTPMSGAGGKAIFGFGENDIWAAGGGIFHFNGAEWEDRTFMDDVLFENREYTCLWGTSSENLYFGNQGGKIVHWDGSRGTLLNVQASEAFRDIYGLDVNNIYAVAGSIWDNQVGELYKYIGSNNWELIKEGSFTPSDNQLRGPFETVWVSSDGEIIIGAHFLHRYWNGTWISQSGPPNFYIEKIRGFEPNDLFACGHFGGLAHYNGIEWHEYTNIYFDGVLYNLTIIKNSIIAVGRKGNQTVVIKGEKF